MNTICGPILMALVGLVGDPGGSLGPVQETVQQDVRAELVELTEPDPSMSWAGEIDDIASLLMAPGAVHAFRLDSVWVGGALWPDTPAPPVSGRTFSWLFASAIGAAFVTFAIIVATASGGD